MKNIFSDFFNLLFPKTCVSCDDALEKNEKYICLKCLYHLPKTFFHDQPENEMEQRFWGKVKIERAVAYFYYEKGSPYQKIIHSLKYKGEKEIGELLGNYFGTSLINSPDFNSVDLIVPVPLHPLKFKKRGYNQSEWIAKGIARKMNKPLNTGNLYRTIENSSQIDKGVYERWENVNNIFSLRDDEAFENKHILLVDDLFTTGATTEACARAILRSANSKVSIATLAIDRL